MKRKITSKLCIKDITVCVCTFNRWESLLKTLNSIINQTAGIPEIIIVDDHSNKKIPKKILNFISRFENISYIRHSKNLGLASARNTGINNTKTEFFTFLDDDDEWNLNYLEISLSKLNLNKKSEIFLCYKNTKYKLLEKNVNGIKNLKKFFLKGFCPPVGMQIYKTKILLKANGYNQAIKSGVDLDLWIRLLKSNPKVKIFWGNYIYVGKSQKERITTNESIRIRESQNSLKLWKNDLIRFRSLDFYNKYYSEYMLHIKAGFLSQNLKNMKFKGALMNNFNLEVFFRLVFNFIKHRLLGYNGNPTLRL